MMTTTTTDTHFDDVAAVITLALLSLGFVLSLTLPFIFSDVARRRRDRRRWP